MNITLLAYIIFQIIVSVFVLRNIKKHEYSASAASKILSLSVVPGLNLLILYMAIKEEL